MLASDTQLGALEALIEQSSQNHSVRRLGREEVLSLVPILRRNYVAGGMLDTDSRDIDVHALLHGYLSEFRHKGGSVLMNTRIEALERHQGRWLLNHKSGELHADVVVNAAGAWADEIGILAGAKPVGLKPKRRTAMMISVPDDIDIRKCPAVIDVDEQFYLKPDAGRLLISPADETPSPPTDAQPEEIDIAVCVDRIQTAFELAIPRIDNAWAGLRSFVDDKSPVCGFDDVMPGFFWLAGQGGYGIQSAPALAQVAAALVRDQTIPAKITDQGFEPDSVAVHRLRR